jgi:hypothetical protein
MKFTMKSPRYKNEKFIERARQWIWNLQWNPQATGMKNPLKAAGNEYEIENEIPKLQEWKINWKCQGMIMKLIMKSPSYRNEKSIEIAREW